MLAAMGAPRMNVLYLFGPNLGALGRRDPETYGSADARRRSWPRPRAAGRASSGTPSRVAPVRPRGRADRLAARRGAATASRPSCSTPVRSSHYSYALRDAIEASGVPVARSAHVQHRRPRVLPAHVGDRRRVPGHDHRPRGRWLSSGAGGDAVDHRREEARAEPRAWTTCLSMRCSSPDCCTRATSPASPAPTDRCSIRRDGAAVPHRRPLHGAVAPRGARPGAHHLSEPASRGAGRRVARRRRAARVRGRGDDGRRTRSVRRRRSATTSSSSPTTDVVEPLRAVKDDEERAAIRAAQAITDAAFERILERFAVGVTEQQIARQLESADDG